MRQEQDYCKRCGNPIEAGMIGKSDICGNCADDLRLDGEAETVFTLSNPYLKQTSLEGINMAQIWEEGKQAGIKGK